MIKSRRKLKSMRVKGKVYDPMPKMPHDAPRVRSHAGRVYQPRMFTYIDMNTSNRSVRVFKSGKKRVTF